MSFVLYKCYAYVIYEWYLRLSTDSFSILSFLLLLLLLLLLWEAEVALAATVSEVVGPANSIKSICMWFDEKNCEKTNSRKSGRKSASERPEIRQTKMGKQYLFYCCYSFRYFGKRKWCLQLSLISEVVLPANNPIFVPGLSDEETVDGGLWLDDVDGGLWLEVEGGLWLAVEGGLWLEVEGGLWLAAEGGLWLDPDDVGGLFPDTLAPEENI